MAAERPLWDRVWGNAVVFIHRTSRLSWVDLVAMIALGGLLFGVIDLGREMTGPHRLSVEIDLSPWALPRYTFFSLSRGLLAYGFSLLFTLVYGYWAAKDRIAERVLVPLLDILQSIPVLGFLPALLLGLSALFPGSNLGVELAAVLMIFTGQAWNMTFSFYHSLRSLPQDQREAATVYRFNWWQRFKWVELPFSTMGLVWNSMMSMAGGWFFLSICEATQLGEDDFRLPGLGSYVSVAVKEGQFGPMLWAIFAMVLMIVALDQLLWRPVTVWAQKFRVEEGGHQEAMSSWFLDWLRRSRLLALSRRLLRRWRARREARTGPRKVVPAESHPVRNWEVAASITAFVLLLAFLGWGAFQLLMLLWQVSAPTWGTIFLEALFTLGRVLLSTALGTLWALPAGLAIGLSPRLSRILQPVVQVAASFPAPMLYPIILLGLTWAHVALDWGSIVLMLMGTQWYILFNVVAGAMAVPADLREAARSYRITGWQRFRVLYFPAVFPYLVTGWVTAAGGAWNASIVAEYVEFKGDLLQAHGLGALICKATAEKNFNELAAGVVVMATLVVVFNHTVWRRLYRLAEERFSLSK
jgi:NitT/TauT family transport system permease protein